MPNSNEPPPDSHPHGDSHSHSRRLHLRDEPSGAGPATRRILAALPTWFGVPESVDEYVALADRTPTVIASLDGIDVGVATIVRHSEYAAEVSVMGVLPAYHRRGIGRAMLQHAEQTLSREGIEFLQVKTLSPRHPDEGYKRTRAFYLTYGFRPLEEFPRLWSPDQPALQLVKVVATPSA